MNKKFLILLILLAIIGCNDKSRLDGDEEGDWGFKMSLTDGFARAASNYKEQCEVIENASLSEKPSFPINELNSNLIILRKNTPFLIRVYVLSRDIYIVELLKGVGTKDTSGGYSGYERVKATYLLHAQSKYRYEEIIKELLNLK